MLLTSRHTSSLVIQQTPNQIRERRLNVELDSCVNENKEETCGILKEIQIDLNDKEIKKGTSKTEQDFMA